MKANNGSKSEIKKVYSYARWSSDAQGAGDSDRRQQVLAEAWCHQRGLTLAGAEKDEGVSAKAGRNRVEGSGLSRLLKIVKPGDYLLVEDNDRLSRQDWLTASTFIRDITAKGVVVVTLANGNEIDHNRFLHDPGCFLPSVLRSFTANDENVKKAARIKASWAARKMAVERGEKPINCNLPGWLRWNAQTKKVDVDEAKAAVVRRMFALYLETGKLFDVSRTLNAEGAVRVSRKSNGQGFSKDFIFRCLTNRAVLGECMGKPGLFPTIVDEASFYRVAERLKLGKHNTTNRTAIADNLFLGLAVCSKCGAPLHRHSQKRNGKTYPYLVCGGALRGTGTCGMGGVNYAKLEESFVFLLTHTVRVREALTPTGTEKSRLEELQGELAVVQGRVNRMLKELEGEENPSRRVMDMIKGLETQETALMTAVEDERMRLKNAAPSLQSYEQLAALDMTSAEHRAKIKSLLHDILDRVVVDIANKRLEAVLKTGKRLAVSWGSAGVWMMSDP